MINICCCTATHDAPRSFLLVNVFIREAQIEEILYRNAATAMHGCKLTLITSLFDDNRISN